MGDLKGRVIGSYRVIERVGQGGMGTVWRARDEQLERDVAIKMLRPDAGPSPENTARLVVEARAAACIRSRHVAQVYELGTTGDGQDYVVMELLEGKTLLEVLGRERRLSAERAARVGRHVAKAMQAAHALGIVHRDLKPANVMLVRSDGEEEVAKVLDFGIAKRTRSGDADLTPSGELLGTLHFMAPEQIEGRAVDARADVYALGALLYRMLSGDNVFESGSLRALSELVVNAPPRPLAERVRVPPRLDAVVLRCLEKAPERRFQTMAEVDDALAASLAQVTASFLDERPAEVAAGEARGDERATPPAADLAAPCDGDTTGDDLTLDVPVDAGDDDVAWGARPFGPQARSAALVAAAAGLVLLVVALGLRAGPDSRALEANAGHDPLGFVHVRTAARSP